VSGISRQAANATLQALEVGAVDFIFKYTPGLDTDPEALRAEIIAKVRAAAKIRVIRSLRHRPTDKPLLPNLELVKRKDNVVNIPKETTTGVNDALLAGGVVVIGASTGGPLALRELLSNIPADYSLPILIVQHMPAVFTKVLAAQLDRALSLAVREAKQGDHLEAGLVLIAPGGYHMLLGSDLQIRLTQGPEVEGHRPSVDVTMQSVVQIYGARTKGILLTGMGKDGCMGLSFIRAKGGKTFVQDGASCVVNGMPQKAIDMGVVDYIAPPAEIGKLLIANQRLPYIKNYA
jgi:two-component system chemotaxis response regulator CheB